MANLSPIPITSAVITTEIDPTSGGNLPTGLVSSPWFEYFLQMQDRVEKSPYAVGSLFDTLTDQTAAIAATSLTISTPTGLTTKLSKGLYRVLTYARITQAASTSSSLTVTLRWTDGTVACTSSGSAITGNTTATTGSLDVMIRSDADADITYETAYSSSGATAMQYRLDIVVAEVAT
jgi:hypothetical protein